MVIEKAYVVKDPKMFGGKFDNVLFPDLDSTVLAGEDIKEGDFVARALISFNDGDYAALCTPEKLPEEYKRLLEFEPDEIEGIPRAEGEVYYQPNDTDLPISMSFDKVIALFH